MTRASIRPERTDDFDALRHIHESAFAPSPVEARLVDDLRAADATVPSLCLVALEDDRPIGHIVYSRVRLESGHEALALAPMAVAPERQRRGIGARLIDESIERARQTDFPLVVVVGHPEYYPRFGFESAAGLRLTAPWELPPEAWMALRLPAYSAEARGMVEYAPAFEA